MNKHYNDKKYVPEFLYVEDFGAASPKKTEEVENIPIVADTPIDIQPSEEIIQEYYGKGIEEGRKLEREIFIKEKMEIEKEFKNNSLNLAENIEKKIEECKKDIFHNVSKVILDSFVTLLPNLLMQYGVKEAEKNIELMVPCFKNLGSIKLTCSKEFFEKIQKYFSEEAQKKLELELDQKMKNGDFSISWDTGQLSHDASAAVQEIMSGLHKLPFIREGV
ncbi:hypothetical protein [Gluconobacter roseus]|uniref:Uncharacterized protein n=1 Tax=Gluconobacter roseus NBRC 3990 TaxID=1307950 RepID=A0A4Y3M5Q2_9PROT|nr:hypothetical protein [Gluconobacter roseus]KXV43613.1 hypothetical protein AD943_08240 [Gluconobacter roseus]GBR47195.1 hypothetical protein AA3990_1700 [Gluconobacter roseus NBRC 3990]GEB04642.1 hypothetical protein GRO01_22180 [Gluconobacter roseus NBRC 3990]GLP92223.1 hypothetical protein GCM10007871_02010 [Gluconobacter roseus NBRC 3990]